MSFRSDVKEALEQLREGMVLYLDSHSNTIQTRTVANEMGKKITISKVGDSRWAVRLKTGRGLALAFASQGDMTAGSYANKARNWESRLTPVGRSGIPREGLAYYPQGHQDIPQDWLVYVEDFDIVFKPRYVRNPVELLNDKLIKAGLPPTRYMLNDNYERISPEEEEKRFNFIRERSAQ